MGAFMIAQMPLNFIWRDSIRLWFEPPLRTPAMQMHHTIYDHF